MKKVWRSFRIDMPEELIDIYEILQFKLIEILNNNSYRNQFENIKLNQHKGRIWYEIRDIIKKSTTELKSKINNSAWHILMLCENIRRILQSQNESKAISNILNKYNYNIEDNEILNKVFEECHKNKIYPTLYQIKNLKRFQSNIELPRDAIFLLDYSISEKQLCRKISNNEYLIRYRNTYKKQEEYKNWIQFKFMFPSSIRHILTGRTSKPVFQRYNNGMYSGRIAYECLTQDENDVALKYDRHLGVDIGRVKQYSCTYVDNENNKISDEYIQSKRIDRLTNKLNRMYEKKKELYAKIQRFDKYKVKDERYLEKQKKRLKNYKHIQHKIIQCKKSISTLSAFEIVDIAKKNFCSTIHIEHLSWLESRAKKWNFSYFQSKLEEFAELENIGIEKVSCTNTSKESFIDSEIGTICNNRKIKFKNNLRIDRDRLASINLSLRRNNSKSRKLKEIPKNLNIVRKYKNKESKRSLMKQEIEIAKNKYLKEKKNDIVVDINELKEAYKEFKTNKNKNSKNMQIVIFLLKKDFLKSHFNVINKKEIDDQNLRICSKFRYKKYGFRRDSNNVVSKCACF